MSNRFYYDEFAEEIFDSKIEDYPATIDICSVLNKQEENIDKYKKEIQKLNIGIVHLKNQLKQTKQQLTEKEKQIKELSEEHFEIFGDMKNYKNLWLAEQRKNKDQDHQVCDEIRKFIAKDLCGCSIEEWTHKIGWNEDLIKVFNKLDQIEKKGEEQ